MTMKKNRKPAPKVTGVKVKRVATVGTPISGTLSVEVGDRDALEVALVENIQRQDLTAIEEADGMTRSRDPEEQAKLKEELARMTFGDSCR